MDACKWQQKEPESACTYLEVLLAQLGSAAVQDTTQPIDLVQGSQALRRVSGLRQGAEHASHFRRVWSGDRLG